MIEAFNLYKSYENFDAVKNMSFTVPGGSTTVILGPSGSGKTTVLKMINRLILPTSGRVHINGRDAADQKPELLRRKIGYVSQNDGLFPHYTIEQNIAVVPQLLGWNRDTIRTETRKIMANVLLSYEEHRRKFPHQLSGGQKQRVTLARAIIASPDLVLMDEPFGALDPVTRAEIRKEFASVIRASGKTTLLVTHDIAEAIELGDQIILMNKGEIVQAGTPREVVSRPTSDFARTFFGDLQPALSMSVLSLADIWPYLQSKTGMSHTQVNSNLTIWETIRLLEKENLTAVNVHHDSDEPRHLDLTSLMTGYRKLQQKNG